MVADRPVVLVFARHQRSARAAAHRLDLARWRYVHQPEQLLGLTVPRRMVLVDGWVEGTFGTQLYGELERMRAVFGSDTVNQGIERVPDVG